MKVAVLGAAGGIGQALALLLKTQLPSGSEGDATAIFSIHDQKDIEIHEVVQQVYDALKEKGYNPVNQLVGYILSEDPTYITTYKGARSLIRKVDRDDLLQAMLRSYLNV